MYKKIEELEKQLNKISQELESLREEEQAWPQFGDDCFYYNSLGEISETTWGDSDFERKSFEFGNFFRTREEAENKVRAIRLETAIARRRKELNDGWKPDWSDPYQNKFYFYYHFECEGVHPEIIINWTRQALEVTSFGVYESEKDAETVAKEFKGDLVWYFEQYLPSIN